MKNLFNRKRILVGILLMLLIAGSVFGITSPTLAATYQDVTVTATPAYIAISNAGGNWTLNDITGDGTIEPDTVYYANPLGDTTVPSTTVVDGECLWTLTDTSTVVVDITTTISNFTGGDATMTNSDDGSNGATTFGSYTWYSGLSYASKVVCKTSGSADLFNGSVPGDADIKWGCEVETRTDAWTGGSSSTATLTITATKQ